MRSNPREGEAPTTRRSGSALSVPACLLLLPVFSAACASARPSRTTELASQPPARAQFLSLDQAVDSLAQQLLRPPPGPRELRLAVLDLQDLRGATPVLGRYLAERLTTRLSGLGRGYALIERRRLSQALDELEFAQSDLVDPTRARRFGRMAGVDAIVVGTVSALPDRVETDVRVVDLETTRVLVTARVSLASNADVVIMLALLPDTRGRAAAAAPAPPAVPERPPTPATPPTPRLPEWSDHRYRVEIVDARGGGRSVEITLMIRNRQTRPDCLALYDLYGIDDLGYEYIRSRSLGNLELLPDLPRRVTVHLEARGAGGGRSIRLVLRPRSCQSHVQVFEAILGPVPLT